MTLQTKKIEEGLHILISLGMPKEQQNDRTSLCLLALLNITPEKEWSQAENPMLGIRGILDFAREKYKVPYAENTRESVRKYSVKQLVTAGILMHNPDDPSRAVNSSENCYQVDPIALDLFKKYNSPEWLKQLSSYIAVRGTLANQYARDRDLHRIPLKINESLQTFISSGSHSELIKAIIERLGPTFISGGELVYIGETGAKWSYFDEKLLSSLNVHLDQHGKMPDVVIYDRKNNWLFLIEATVSTGPVDSGRHSELRKLFQSTTAGLIFITAFPDRGEIFKRFLSVVAWETEVWCASDPDHLIHFNGERFLGPYSNSSK
jgi:hypothetical protein